MPHLANFAACSRALLASGILCVCAVAVLTDPWKYGNSHFGNWVVDPNGGIAFSYTANQVSDPLAFDADDQLDPFYRGRTEQNFQVANGRLVGYSSNYGWHAMRVDEDGPKWLHDWWPEAGQYGAGIGYLTADTGSNASSGAGSGIVLTTLYPGHANASVIGLFDRVYGLGYSARTVTTAVTGITVRHEVFTPPGTGNTRTSGGLPVADPVMISRVTITNGGTQATGQLAWTEASSGLLRLQDRLSQQCRNFPQLATTMFADAKKFSADHYPSTFSNVSSSNYSGLSQSRVWRPLNATEQAQYEAVQAFLTADAANDTWHGPVPPGPTGTGMWDVTPPTSYLVDVTAAGQEGLVAGTEWGTDCAAYYGPPDAAANGTQPAGATQPLVLNWQASDGSACFLARRRLSSIAPGSSVTLTFLWATITAADAAAYNATIAGYVQKYAAAAADGSLLNATVAAWMSGPRVRLGSSGSGSRSGTGDAASVPSTWVEREALWHYYMTASSMTLDDAFQEASLDQGTVYRYVFGGNIAMRDPAQHALPLLFSSPAAGASILRYILKTVLPIGAASPLGPPNYNMPYGVTGSGLHFPFGLRPSDQELYVLHLAAQYILVSRDTSILQQPISYYGGAPATVADILLHCLDYSIHNVSVGKHGLMRVQTSDWSDSLCADLVLGCHQGNAVWERFYADAESVLNAAVAAYVLPLVAEALTLADPHVYAPSIAAARAFAAGQVAALNEQAWNANHTWLLRAYLGDDASGWLGQDNVVMIPHAFALMAGALSPADAASVVATLDAKVRQASPIGAMSIAPPIYTSNIANGTGENGGVWPSLNHPLVLGLLTVNATMAAQEWLQNSMAVAAQTYPDFWAGTWSGSDSTNSALSAQPGQNNWASWRIQNLHRHAWPIYTLPLVLTRARWNASGLLLAPPPWTAATFGELVPGLRQTDDTPLLPWSVWTPTFSVHCSPASATSTSTNANKTSVVVWRGHASVGAGPFNLSLRLPVEVHTPHLLLHVLVSVSHTASTEAAGQQATIEAACDTALHATKKRTRIVQPRAVREEEEEEVRAGMRVWLLDSVAQVPAAASDAAVGEAGKRRVLCWQVQQVAME